MRSLGTQEIVLIQLVMILLFVAKKIPELTVGLDNGIKEFEKTKKDADKGIDKGILEKSGSEMNS